MTFIPRRRRALGLLALAAFAPCVVLLCGKYPLDLDVYRAGGRAVLTGHDLYTVRLQGYGFTYPPLAAMLFTAFAALPLGAATVLLTAVSLGCLGLLAWRCAPELLRRAPSGRGLAALACLLACEPVRATLWNGQINLVLAALVVTDLIGRRSLRGIGIGVAAAIKLTPAIFVLYLLVRGRRREAAHAVAAFVLVTGWAWLVLPGESRRFWTHEVFAGGGIGDIARTSNQSLLGVSLRLAGPGLAYWIWAALIGPTAVVALRIARTASERDNEALAVGVVGIAGCLISPVSWSHHWIWCIPWLIGLWTWARTRLARRWTIGLGVLFVVTNFLPRSVSDAWPPSELVLGNAFVLAAVLTVAVWVRDERTASSLHSPGASAKPELALG